MRLLGRPQRHLLADRATRAERRQGAAGGQNTRDGRLEGAPPSQRRHASASAGRQGTAAGVQSYSGIAASSTKSTSSDAGWAAAAGEAGGRSKLGRVYRCAVRCPRARNHPISFATRSSVDRATSLHRSAPFCSHGWAVGAIAADTPPARRAGKALHASPFRAVRPLE
jgi:hypothetical protein